MSRLNDQYLTKLFQLFTAQLIFWKYERTLIGGIRTKDVYFESKQTIVPTFRLLPMKLKESQNLKVSFKNERLYLLIVAIKWAAYFILAQSKSVMKKKLRIV